ncbi:MAG: NRDE family protein [Rhodospirillales bacterium]|jgi:uncharacterized protein with NRDE domain|nr:NRDE family protein [Rhodospirillales bacterium]MDP6805084.1 NRDE family protein [Rhodospirillales bacterium]
MCTVVILRRPAHPWPLVLAANRDEMADRPSRPPGRHWPECPDVVAGRDETAGGTWLGFNDSGLVACVLNRPGSLGPAPSLRSRGELPLAALRHADAASAAEAVAAIETRDYRSFNLVVADRANAYWLCSREGRDDSPDPSAVEVVAIPEGLSMVTAHDLNDDTSPRCRRYRPAFAAARAPDPETDDWRSWTDLLESRSFDPDAGPMGAMTVITDTGFGTLSSSLVALAAQTQGAAPRGVVWLFAPGRPGEVPYEPVAI